MARASAQEAEEMQVGTRRLLTLLLVTAAEISGCGSCPPVATVLPATASGGSSASARHPAEGPEIAAMNRFFRDSYARDRDAASAARTVIVVNFGRMLLQRDGETVEEVQLASPAFHVLKAFAHLPFGVYLAVSTPSSDTATYAEAVHAAVVALEGAPLSEDQRSRCRDLTRFESLLVAHRLPAVT